MAFIFKLYLPYSLSILFNERLVLSQNSALKPEETRATSVGLEGRVRASETPLLHINTATIGGTVQINLFITLEINQKL